MLPLNISCQSLLLSPPCLYPGHTGPTGTLTGTAETGASSVLRWGPSSAGCSGASWGRKTKSSVMRPRSRKNKIREHREDFYRWKRAEFQSIAYRTLSWFSPERASGSMYVRSFPASRLRNTEKTGQDTHMRLVQCNVGGDIQNVHAVVWFALFWWLIVTYSNIVGHYL